MARPLLRLAKFFEDFSSGLNSLFSPVLINDNEASDLQNVRLREKGTVSKRGGTAKKNATGLTGGVLAMHSLYRKDGTKYLLYVIGTVLYKFNTSTGANEVVKTGLTAGKRMRFVTYRDKVYCTNGADAMFTYDGTSVVNVGGSPPTSPLIAAYKNHLFAVDPTTPNRARFSDLDNPDSWPALNFIDINSDDGDKLTAYEDGFRGRLLLFKERSIWQIYGDSVSNFTLDGPRSNYGAVNQEVVKIIGDLILFLSREGVVAYDGAGSVLASEKIDPDIKTINQTAIDQACAYVYRNEYGLSVPYSPSTTNNRILVWDSLRRAWMRDVGINAGAFTIWAPSGIDLLYSGGAALPYLYEHEQDARNDDGVAIDAYYATKIWDFGYDVEKKFRSVRVYLRMQETTGSVDIEVDRDRIGYDLIQTINTTDTSGVWDSADWDAAVWDKDAEAKPFRIPYSKRATQIRVRVRNNLLDQNFGLYRLGFFFRARPPVK